MVDRKPTYKNRVLVTKEADGTQEYVTWEHADSPITEGTPLNKQNLMSDEAAAAVGLTADATPSKAFEAIGARLSGLDADVGNLKCVSVSLPASGWSGSAPYTQTVSVSGMTEDWVPGIPTIVYTGRNATNLSIDTLLDDTEALGYIKLISSAAGKLTFTAPEDKPRVSFTLRVPGMVER